MFPVFPMFIPNLSLLSYDISIMAVFWRHLDIVEKNTVASKYHGIFKILLIFVTVVWGNTLALPRSRSKQSQSKTTSRSKLSTAKSKCNNRAKWIRPDQDLVSGQNEQSPWSKLRTQNQLFSLLIHVQSNGRILLFFLFFFNNYFILSVKWK